MLCSSYKQISHLVRLGVVSLCMVDCCQYTVCRWYFGKIKRIEAEKKLLQADNEHGSFLIRDSESRHHDFSLSSRYLQLEHTHLEPNQLS